MTRPKTQRRRAPGLPLWLAALAGVLAAAACSAPVLDNPFGQGAADTPTPRVDLPTLTPEPSMLVICLGEEPDTFYPFGPRNAAAGALLPLVYDGPIDVLGYQFTPVLLERIPSVEAGEVRFEPIRIVSGDLYFNPETGLPEEFLPGKSYFPSGCTSMDCRRKYEGGGAELDRMVVDFHLRPGLVWSDGEALTAEDSVFGYRVDSDPATPGVKDQVNRTSAYEALDPATVRWTGIPGFIDPEFGGNFWSPLPEHLLTDIPLADVPHSEAVSRMPVGWGPYRLVSWEAGVAMEFEPNANYANQTGDPPGFEVVRVRFLEERGDGVIQQLLTGECDVLDESLAGLDTIATVTGLADQGRLQLSSVPGPVVERMDFNLSPVDGRPAFFGDPEVRRAIAACLDRSSMIDEAVTGLSPVPSGYLPEGHPLSMEGAGATDPDPAAAAASLEALGWIDDDGDPSTARIAQGVKDIPGGTPFQVSLLTTDDAFHSSLGEQIARGLGECGIEVGVERIAADRLYEPWPEGPVFGRAFDLVLWPWMNWISPACEVFTTSEIPSDASAQGSNASGFSNAAFDAACREAALGPAAGAAYRPALDSMETILHEEVISIAILQWPRMLASGSGVCGATADATALSLFWDIESWTRGEACAE